LAAVRHHGEVSAPTQTLPDVHTQPEGTDTTGNDTPKMFHYVRKNKIAESAVMGTHVVALCGEVFPVTRAAKPGSPVCPQCKEIFESLPAGGDSD
jgi:formylmethanofuran dehydrogenase subunit E